MKEADLAATALDVLRQRYQTEPVDPDYILPADIPLELSGEAVRSRLCLFTDERGNEMAMRPDLTLPVALQEVQRRMDGHTLFRTYIYAARAFRLPANRDDPLEFSQIGFEEFGHDRLPADDVRPFCNVRLALDACGIVPAAVVTGDLAIFPAVADALGLPESLTGLIKRAFRQEGGVRALLSSPPAPMDPEITAILEAEAPEAALRAHMEQRSVAMIGARSEGEILHGLRERAAAAAAGGIPAGARQVLEDLGRINCPLAEADDAITQLAKAHGLAGLDGVADNLAKRTILMCERGIVDPSRATFRAGFGRRFTYYDGFVFEMLADGLTAAQPVAAGGRYDGLIANLSGGRVSANGIGGVVRPDRMVRARRAAA
jgi:ATP phosphoribosyltransferase regulatory subunit